MLLTDEIRAVVEEAMEQLPEDLRTAIVLRELEGLSYEEIAEAMDCPVGTVRSRIFRAREAIDKKLKPLLRLSCGLEPFEFDLSYRGDSMTDALNEQLSACLDGELPPAELDLLLKRVGREAELRAAIGRYSLIGEAMRAERPAVASRDFASKVMAAVAAEPAQVPAPGPIARPNVVQTPAPSRVPPRFLPPRFVTCVPRPAWPSPPASPPLLCSRCSRSVQPDVVPVNAPLVAANNQPAANEADGREGHGVELRGADLDHPVRVHPGDAPDQLRGRAQRIFLAARASLGVERGAGRRRGGPGPRVRRSRSEDFHR